MSGTIADKLYLLAETKENIRQAIENKGVAVGKSDAFSLYPEKINAISTGGTSSTATGEYLVMVIDYDGTVIDRQYLNAGDVYELPTPPEHDRITFDSWSCPVAVNDNKITMPEYDVIIGPTYTINSGKLEIDVLMNEITGLTYKMSVVGTKDWGDGTVDNLTEHTYAEYGSYTIVCDNASLSQYNNLTWRSAGIQQNNTCVVSVLIPNITLGSEGLAALNSLQSVVFGKGIGELPRAFFGQYTNLYNCCILPNGMTSISQNYADSGTGLPWYVRYLVIPNTVSYINFRNFHYDNLEYLTVPESVTTIYRGDGVGNLYAYTLKGINFLKQDYLAGLIQNCYNLEHIYLAEGITTIRTGNSTGGSSTFVKGSKNLKKVVFPSTVTEIGGYAFEGCPTIEVLDFTKCTQIPTLDGTNAFNAIKPYCKILVPAELYEQWITATNWTTYAPYIVKPETINVTVTTDSDNAQILGGVS